MTKRFDTLLLEMMPASLEGGFGDTVRAAKEAVPPKDQPTYHFKALQALEPDVQEQVIKSIVQKVFPEKDFTYSADISDRVELKSAVADAIRETAKEIPEFKPGGNTMVNFLADRLTNKKLLGSAKYTSEDGEESSDEEITQKDFKQALDKALTKADETGSITDEPSDEEIADKTDMVYTKAADIDTEDEDVEKAFNKLPEGKELSWKQVLKIVGLTSAEKLLVAGGLTEEPKAEEDVELDDPEEGGIQDLEFDNEEDDLDLEADISNFDKMIDPYFSRSSSPYANDEY